MGRLPALTAALAVLAVCLPGCGSRSPAPRPSAAPGRTALSPAPGGRLVLDSLPLRQITRLRLPSRWALSFDVALPAGARLAVDWGGGRQTTFRRRGAHHIEATPERLWIDGEVRPLRGASTGEVTLAPRGEAHVRAVVAGPASDPTTLLLARLAELHARLAPRASPLGASLQDRIHLHAGYWTSGFWPGALWRGAALGGGHLFRAWALRATLSQLGGERTPSHDVGFRYGEGSLNAWLALCRGGPGTPTGLCRRLRGSVVAASVELRRLAATNRAAGTIPTGPGSARADTIIDSTMNISILPWASRFTGDQAYRRLALRHARRVAALLVRRDGSTAQAVDFARASGRVLSIGTHQGMSASSTWSRGQAWAVLGFAQAAAELRDRSLLRVALRTGQYVRTHLPGGGVPRWDYEAPAGAPVDVSAGVITAAGLMYLARDCRWLPGVCRGADWRAQGSLMLAAALRHASRVPPLGLLGAQVLNERGGPHCWCNTGELIFGLTYGLDALQLETGATSVATALP